MSVRSTDAPPARPSSSPQLRNRQKAAIALGDGLEFYDFSVLGFFAVPIGQTFFPTTDPRTALLLSVGTVGIGYFARPLGALVIGHYADRRGRKPAMLATILLMAFVTLGIGTAGLCVTRHRVAAAAPGPAHPPGLRARAVPDHVATAVSSS